ncbi:MAG: response regulator transcription factor, partial [Mesorhizobium sp.]
MPMPATQSSSEIAYNGPMKILVIEDDREAADYLQKAFT